MAASADWAALFLQSPSPGAVFRFLQRRRPANAPDALLLSDALSADGWRAMLGERAFLTAQAGPLSVPFPPAVYLLYREGDRWGWTLWENGEEKERFEEATSPPQVPAWKTLLGVRPPLAPPLVWARERRLPLSRIPGAVPGVKPVPVIAYSTVSSLDQRNLLVETSPRLYRFASG